MAMSRSQMEQQVSKSPSKEPRGLTYYKNGGRASPKSKGSKICPAGKAWDKRTFDTYTSGYATMAASTYCKDPHYAQGAKGKTKKKAY